ncbi:MAG: phosphopantetheine-binding protein [Tannerella sp.]|jgi:acyl carrier protein|nr:phosphopantetheine-binding protein [Tannerella sp.]
MKRQEIEDKVNAFLIEEWEIDKDVINSEARLKEDIGLDSLDYVDIVVVVEKTFGFKIKPEDMSKVLTLSNFYDYIESKINT